MIAFSIENSSEGRPYIFQSLILTASPRVLGNENDPEFGIFFSWHFYTQRWDNSFLNTESNAPKYAIIPAEIRTSPVKLW